MSLLNVILMFHSCLLLFFTWNIKGGFFKNLLIPWSSSMWMLFSQCLTLLFSSVFLFCPSVLFYQAQTEHPGDSAHSHRWTSLELVKGTYSTDDSPSDIAEIRLDKAVPLKVLRILHMNHAKNKLHFGTNSLPPCCSCRRVWNMLSACVTMAVAQPMGMEA